jgi:hypothetical protein
MTLAAATGAFIAWCCLSGPLRIKVPLLAFQDHKIGVLLLRAPRTVILAGGTCANVVKTIKPMAQGHLRVLPEHAGPRGTDHGFDFLPASRHEALK